jgi:SAM-dependent methyltransferase
MSAGGIERFWDARARENAAYYIDNALDYTEVDMARFWERGREVVDFVSERLGVAPAPSDEVVEIGCGIGRVTRVLAERSRRVWAFDVSAEMLRRAREQLGHIGNIEWVHGDGATLRPLRDRVASACFSFLVLQHLPDPALTLGYVSEMGRVLRPGGWSAFQVSNDPRLHRPWPRPSLGTRLKQLAGRAPRGHDNPAWLGSSVDLDALERTADAAGMDVERIDGRGTQFCLVLLRKRGAVSEHEAATSQRSPGQRS